MFREYVYGGYDAALNTTFHADAGWPGAPLLSAMLDAAKNGPELTEFSAHDTTIMPLYSAMGNHSWAYPDFATAVIFEVYEGSSSAATKDSSDNLFVKVRVGTCDQYPGTHAYTITDYVASCMNAAGELYRTAAGCPLADLERFAATRTGTFASKMPMGCYAWPHDLVVNNCTGMGPVDPSSHCGAFRQQCPFTACGAGKYMTADLACHPISSN